MAKKSIKLGSLKKIFSNKYMISLPVILGLCLVFLVGYGVNSCLLMSGRSISETSDGVPAFLPSQASENDIGEKRLNNSPIDFNSLWDISRDVCGYIEIPDTTVSYPVMINPEYTDFYLDHYIDGRYDESGSIFMQRYNSENFTDLVTVLYGHNMFGRTDAERPYFAFFQKEYSNPEFLAAHPYVYIYLPSKTLKYEVCALVPYTDDHIFYIHDFSVEGEFGKFMDEIYSRSGDYVCFADRDRPAGDKPVLVLSTCYMWDSSKRYLLVAELCEDVEMDITSPSVADR